MADLKILGPLEFVVVIRADSTSFKYSVYLLPLGKEWDSYPTEYIRGADTLRGAMRAIRKERRRRSLGAQVVHRETL